MEYSEACFPENMGFWKYLRHVPSEYVTDHAEDVGTETVESNNSSESGAAVSVSCENTQPSGRVDEQATQTEEVVTTRSG